MNTEADTTEIKEPERRDAVKQAAGLDDPADREESDAVVEVE